MMKNRQDLIRSLMVLQGMIKEGPPEKVILASIRANPWFTVTYIKQSCASIARWLSQEVLSEYDELYVYPTSKKHIGIIAAGNIPLVGFHDVLVSALSGHNVSVKCSHQDEILMNWIILEWKKILPSIGSYIQIVKKIRQVDYLIATGSNNTARYLNTGFKDVPKIIRKNRFSIGLLTPETTNQQLQFLAEDVLLHNGLGCRNVSNCLIVEGFDLQKWVDTLKSYSKEKLNPAYLRKLTYEKARLITLGKDFIDAGTALLITSESFSFGNMGIISLQFVSSIREANRFFQQYEDSIQCIVGLDVEEGQTQWPGLFTYADKVDTPEILGAL